MTWWFVVDVARKCHGFPVPSRATAAARVILAETHAACRRHGGAQCCFALLWKDREVGVPESSLRIPVQHFAVSTTRKVSLCAG